jgi:hypothetical protein
MIRNSIYFLIGIIQNCHESIDYYIETDQNLEIDESEDGHEIPFHQQTNLKVMIAMKALT